MVANRLTWITIFSRFSHPCTVTDVLANGMLAVVVVMLSGMEIIVVESPTITLESFVGVTDVVEVVEVVEVIGMLIIDVATAIDVDILADENVNGLAAVMTPLEFTLPAP